MAGFLWYTSGREVPRGFRSSVAFRCDPAKDGPKKALPEGKGALADGATGSISLVVHNHRAALGKAEGGGGEGGESGTVPNSLSVVLEPDGEGGGQVLVR